MATRKRIDWSVIMGPEATTPVWGNGCAPSELVATFTAFSSLFGAPNADALLKRAVELALDPVGLVRAGIYVYDEPLQLMLGTWGTNLEGCVVDERHAMFELDDNGRRVFDRALSNEASWTLVEDCPIIDQSGHDTRVVGTGWVVCTPICSSSSRLAMMYNDAGLTGAPPQPDRQDRAAVLCSLLGALLESKKGQPQFAPVPKVSARHPTLRKALLMLARDPSLGGDEMAKTLGISLSRLARLFKVELGVSLVEHRNRLRLERFMTLMGSGSTTLLEAALAAGFGSYAQFHRVFRALHGQTPREYLSQRGLPEADEG